MARLIRMDDTGHSTLAEWTAADDAAFEAAVDGVPRAARPRATIGVRQRRARATREQVRDLPATPTW